MKKNPVVIPGLIFSLAIGWHSISFAEVVMDTIIVTVQKREEIQQDVPVSVSVYSDEMLTNSGIRDVFDLQYRAPGLVVDHSQSSTTTNFNIRGIGTSGQNFGLEPSVGIYVDGVYRARPSSAINDFIDITSIEVLKGPQGTLFGRNTLAGAILINTNLPKHETSGFAEIGFGNFGLTEVKGTGSFSAIEDILAVSFAGFHAHRDGYVDDISTTTDATVLAQSSSISDSNSINDRERYGFRFQAFYTPREDLSIRVIADKSEINEICCGTLVILDNNIDDQRRSATDPFPQGSDVYFSQNGMTLIPGSRTFDQDVAYNHLPKSTNKDSGLSVQVDWDHKNYTLTSITAVRSFDTTDDVDTDFTDLDIISSRNEAKSDTFSQELRITGEANKLIYVGGLYYFTQDLDSDTRLDVGEHTNLAAAVNQNIPQATLDLVNAFPANGYVTNVNKQDHKSIALFAHIDYALRDDLSLLGGIRYTDEDKQLKAIYDEVNAGPGFVFFDTVAPRADIDLDLDDFEDTSNTTYTVKVAWDYLEDIMFYAFFGTGYKSGGTNTDRISILQSSVFKAETSTSFELGMKAEFPEKAMRLNMSIHTTDYDDLQVNTFTGDGFNLQNAASADVYGAEIEFTWLPDETTSVFLAYTYLNTEYGDFDAGNCWVASPFRGVPDPNNPSGIADSCDRSGGRLSLVAENFLALGVKKDYYLNEDVMLYSLGEVSWRDEQVMRASNDPLEIQDGYTLVNLRFGLVYTPYDTEIVLWGRNVTDEEYYGNTFDAPLQEGKLMSYVKEPRTYGLTARKHF